MPVPAVEPCVGPIMFVCDLVSNATGSAQAAASDYVLGGIAGAFVHAAAQLGELALSALGAATAVDLSALWLRSNVAVLAAITLPFLVGQFVVQVVTSVLRREAGGLARAVVGVGKAVIGGALALAATQLALTAVDEICQAIAATAGTTVVLAAAQFFAFTALATSTSPALQLIVGVLLCVGFLMLWGVLLFRKAALILIAVFAPVAFAGSAWDQTRVWTRRWLEIVAALVFSKLVIVVVFVVGASAFTGTGPSPTGDGATIDASRSLSDILVGVLLLAMTERRGPGWIALAPLLGVPLMLLIGTGAALNGPAFIPVLLLGAVTVGTGHAAVISITSVYYPSAVRATGGGWASFIAKFAAVAAPIYGARFLAGREGAMAGYTFTAICLAGVLVGVLSLAYFARGLRAEAHPTVAPAE